MARSGWLRLPAEVASRAGLALALALGLAATGCGGGGGSDHPIKIAFLTDCSTSLAQYRPQWLAGAELPFLSRGAKLRVPDAADGVTEATVAERRVRLLLPCESYGEFGTLLGTLRRVVEND